MTKAVLFDVDGTLIDTVDLHAKAWVEALQHFGIRSTFEDMRLQIGKGGDQVLLGLLPPAELERKGEEIQEFRSDLFKRKYLPEARAFPAVCDYSSAYVRRDSGSCSPHQAEPMRWPATRRSPASQTSLTRPPPRMMPSARSLSRTSSRLP